MGASFTLVDKPVFMAGRARHAAGFELLQIKVTVRSLFVAPKREVDIFCAHTGATWQKECVGLGKRTRHRPRPPFFAACDATPSSYIQASSSAPPTPYLSNTQTAPATTGGLVPLRKASSTRSEWSLVADSTTQQFPTHR